MELNNIILNFISKHKKIRIVQKILQKNKKGESCSFREKNIQRQFKKIVPETITEVDQWNMILKKEKGKENDPNIYV